MLLLPPKEGTCPVCAWDHPDHQPHNIESMYYQYRFYGVRGRWPTWADAMAHCSEEVKEVWRMVLERDGMWSEPEDGEPIADPPAESFRQAIGDINTNTFGPEEE